MNFMRRLRRLTFAVLAGGALMVGAVSVSIGFDAIGKFRQPRIA